MVLVNERFLALPESYLFSEVAAKVAAFKAGHPEADVIRLGIGDVTRPLTPAVIRALHSAVDEMADGSTFRGYGPEQGYEFLRQTIIEHDFASRGVSLSADEVFVSDGAKSDTGNFTDILAEGNRIAVTDPVYPVYIDSNVMAGRAGELQTGGCWDKIVYLTCRAENDFKPDFPAEIPDVIYLCFPNNPTGAALNKQELKAWVDYALEHRVLLLFDAAYEAYIHEDDVPHSIYEIEGAKRVAVEFRSFSKTAGFTGLRCGYTVVPHELNVYDRAGHAVELNRLWNRRQCTKFNGTAYIIQRAAEAVYSPEGRREVADLIAYYMDNARTIRAGLLEAGFKAFGGINSPYVWLQVPEGMTSWTFFDRLLSECHVVGTPGVGFGPGGEGYFRLTGFGDRERTERAIRRICEWKR